MKIRIKYFLGLIICLSVNQFVFSQENQSSENQALAKTSQNPIASLTTLPLQFNFNLGMGEYDRMQTVINIQPVLPLTIGKNWNMINRIIIPVMVQPDFNAETGSTTGLGTINYTAFFSPNLKGKVAIGFGPSLLIPTNSASALGDGQFAIGPSVVLFAGFKKWTLGFVAAQDWAYYTPNTGNKHSSFFVQYFINYNLKKAWSVGMAPTITVNWDAEKDEQATVPFGINVAKVTRLGKQPMRFSLAYYYNAVRPTMGAKGGQIQAMIVFLFPKK